MSALTINIAPDRLQQLNEAAADLGVTVEELVNRSIEECITRHQRVREATDYVLAKNAELYRRLAQ